MRDEVAAPPMMEHRTVLLAKEGHRDAFRSLYDEHRERIYRLAFRYTRSPQDADDVMQETFIRAFRHLETADFETDSSFSGWVSTICVHCAIDHLRRTKRQKGNEQLPLSELPREPESREPAPDRVVEGIRAVAWIRNAMRRLSPGQQVVFDLRYREHLDIKEIARRTSCSESSVKTQLGRAVAKLREALRPVWGEP
jgi:RNA polymerase sigma-70 factor (ECF subfamily)